MTKADSQRRVKFRREHVAYRWVVPNQCYGSNAQQHDQVHLHFHQRVLLPQTLGASSLERVHVFWWTVSVFVRVKPFFVDLVCQLAVRLESVRSHWRRRKTKGSACSLRPSASTLATWVRHTTNARLMPDSIACSPCGAARDRLSRTPVLIYLLMDSLELIYVL